MIWKKQIPAKLADEIRDIYEPNQDESLNYIGLGNIEQQNLTLNSVGISSDTQSSKKKFKTGDTLFGTLRPYFRKVIKARFDGVCSTDITVLRPKIREDKDFLFYFIANRSFIDYASAHSSGTRMPRANWRQLSQSEWNIPTQEIRKKIGSFLSVYDDLIENNTRRIQILEEMAQRIYKDWFVHFRFPGHENVKMVDSKLGVIPKGWEVKTTEEVMQVLGGGTPSTKKPEYWEGGTINWYSPKDLTASKSTFMLESGKKITNKGLQRSSAKLFPKNSVMLTSRATIGVVSINITEACTNQGFITCVPTEYLSAYQIYFWMLENVEKFLTLASGATFKELTKSIFRKLRLIVPPKNVSAIFNKVISPIEEQILNIQKKQVILRQIRDLLLPKLISGKIDVSELDIDIGANAA